VAVSEGQSLGHVISSYVDLVPGTRRVLQVGPLAVVRRTSGGRRLRAAAGRRSASADDMGEPLLLIEGSPTYYGRFGLHARDEQGIEPPPRRTARSSSCSGGYALTTRRCEAEPCTRRRPSGSRTSAGVQGEQQARRALGCLAFLSASIPAHGRVTFPIGTRFPAL
jgi:hypothetical protein